MAELNKKIKITGKFFFNYKIITAVLCSFACSVIRLYQYLISPMLAKNCRFEPSCSQYALEAIKKFGLLRGFLYTILRLLRCQPFSKYGYDPVPEKTNLTNSNHKRLAASSTSATSALTNSTLNKESS